MSTDLSKEERADELLYTIEIGPRGEREDKPYTQADLNRAAEFKAREIFQERLAARLGESTSAAASWLRQYQASHFDFVQEITLLDDEGALIERYFVKQFSDSEVVEVGVLMARAGYSLLEMEDLEAQHAYNCALLTIGTCADQTGTKRFFGDENEARLFYEGPGRVSDISQTLRMAILQLNPKIAKKKTPSQSIEATGSQSTNGG